LHSEGDKHAPCLELNGYGALFGRRIILADISFSLPRVGVDVLMGPVKAGKSTLFRSLAGVNEVNPLFRSWGEARLQGVPVSSNVRPALVQQNAQVLSGTVKEAIVGQLRSEASRSIKSWDEFVFEALESYGLPELISQLDSPVFSLKTHQQRAIQIVRTAVTEPALMLIDEPTANLAESDAAALIRWLRQLGERHRLLVALHHQGQARLLADGIILIGGGYVLTHDTNDRFFHPSNTNEHVRQFLRSGSLALPAPDASADDLDASAGALRALPERARAALSAALQSVPTGAEPAPIIDRTPSPPPLRGDVHVFKAPATPRIAPAELPAPSATGVDEASTVGLVTLSDHTGPRGFQWIIPGKLAGCPEPGVTAPLAYDLELLHRAGVNYLITLTEQDLDHTALRRHGLQNLHLPIFDREAPSVNQTYMLLIRIQRLMEAGKVLAVHCKAGLGRTGTILAAWLIREGGLSAGASISRLRMINKGFVQTTTQEEFLAEFEADLINRVR